MTLLKQWKLLLLIASGQLLCLTLGVFWFSGWLQRSVMDGERIQILQANEALARFLAGHVNQLGVDGRRDSGEWSEVQKLLEKLQLPNEGFACIADAQTGQVHCHSLWRTQRDRRPTTIHEIQLWDSHGTRSLRELFDDSDDARGQHFNGYAELDDGIHLIAARPLDGLSAILLVHQRERNVRVAAQELVKPIKSIGFGVATLITLLGLSVNSLILQKYENRLAGTNQRLEQLVNIRTKSLVKTRNAIIFGLAKLAESRDTDTGEHLDRIRRYVTILAERLAKTDRSIDRDFIANLGLASSLHDIGKVGIPDAVLLKPGRLDDQERKIIEQHPTIGRRCLEAIQEQLGNDDFLEMARMIADSHHERWDGAGYPRRLQGEEIPLVARIVALADVYDALTTKRPYKDAMSHETARKIIVEGKASHFDPRVVEAFLATQKEFQTIAEAGQQVEVSPLLATVSLSNAAALAASPPSQTS